PAVAVARIVGVAGTVETAVRPVDQRTAINLIVDVDWPVDVHIVADEIVSIADVANIRPITDVDIGSIADANVGPIINDAATTDVGPIAIVDVRESIDTATSTDVRSIAIVDVRESIDAASTAARPLNAATTDIGSLNATSTTARPDVRPLNAATTDIGS